MGTKTENRNGHFFRATGERSILGATGTITVVISGDMLMRPVSDKIVAAVGCILRGVWPVGLECVGIQDGVGLPKGDAPVPRAAKSTCDGEDLDDGDEHEPTPPADGATKSPAVAGIPREQPVRRRRRLVDVEGGRDE